MTIFKQKKNKKLYTLHEHRRYGRWIEAIPYQHDGKILKSAELKDYIPMYTQSYNPNIGFTRN